LTLLFLVVEIEVAIVPILHLEALPAVLNVFIHFREHPFQVVDHFECTTFDIVFVERVLIIAVHALQLLELLLYDLRLLD